MTPLALYQDAESKIGQEGARKRWRLACHAMAPACTDQKALALYAVACASHKRADWRDAARALATPWGIQNAKPAFVPTEPRPATLLEFLSNAGGLADTQGDLKAMDAHLWHKAKAFRRRLVRPDGLSLDYAADLAFERGYFDDIPPPCWTDSENTHPVTERMLLEAIGAELAGRVRLPNACENAPYYVEPEPEDYERAWNEAYYEEAA